MYKHPKAQELSQQQQRTSYSEEDQLNSLLCNLYPLSSSNDAEQTNKEHHLDDILLDTVRTVKLTPGRCFSPLIGPPPATPTPVSRSRLLFSDSLALIGDTSLVANLDGENEQRRVFAGDACAFTGSGGDTAAVGLTGSTAFPWILSLDPSALGGDLTRNLCGVCRASAMTGDRVL